MTRNDARALWTSSGLTYEVLTPATARRLISLIDAEMRASGLMDRTYRMRRKWADRGCVALRCKAFYFDDREAVTFNPDGFVGFAGWADDENVAPVLTGFQRWILELTAMQSKGAPRWTTTR